MPEVFAAQHRRFVSVASLLGPEPWACLGRFTIADIAAAPMLWRFLRSGADLAEYPRIDAWGAAVSQRPAWRDQVGPETGI